MPRFEVTRTLPLPPEAAWDHYVASSWSQLGHLPVVVKTPQKGDAETKVGNRRVICYGLQKEEILQTQRPAFIEYTAFRSCLFPVRAHKGRVEFAPEGEEGTRMTWTVEYEAHAWLRCFVSAVIRCAIPMLANDVLRTATREAKDRQ